MLILFVAPQFGDRAGFGATQPGAEIVPEGAAELGTGFGEAEEGIAAIAAEITAGATADLAFRHLTADGIFGAVGMQRDLRPIEGHQQLGFVGMESGKQAVEGSKAGATLEDATTVRPRGSAGARGESGSSAAGSPAPALHNLRSLIIFVAFEAGTGRHRDGEHLILDRNPGLMAPAAPARPGGLGELASSMQLGLPGFSRGRPFSPFSRATSARRSVISARWSAITRCCPATSSGRRAISSRSSASDRSSRFPGGGRPLQNLKWFHGESPYRHSGSFSCTFAAAPRKTLAARPFAPITSEVDNQLKNNNYQ